MIKINILIPIIILIIFILSIIVAFGDALVAGILLTVLTCILSILISLEYKSISKSVVNQVNNVNNVNTTEQLILIDKINKFLSITKITKDNFDKVSQILNDDKVNFMGETNNDIDDIYNNKTTKAIIIMRNNVIDKLFDTKSLEFYTSKEMIKNLTYEFNNNENNNLKIGLRPDIYENIKNILNTNNTYIIKLAIHLIYYQKEYKKIKTKII
jgi:hypothetical protein